MWKSWKSEMLGAILIGVTLFVTDFMFGWLTFLTGPFPMIFVIAFVVGIIAGGINRGVMSVFITLIIGIALGYLLVPLAIPGFDPESVVFGRLVAAIIWPLRGTFFSMFGDSLIEAFLGLIVVIILAPLFYLLSLVAGVLGGVIGDFLKRRLTVDVQKTVSDVQN